MIDKINFDENRIWKRVEYLESLSFEEVGKFPELVLYVITKHNGSNDKILHIVYFTALSVKIDEKIGRKFIRLKDKISDIINMYSNNEEESLCDIRIFQDIEAATCLI